MANILTIIKTIPQIIALINGIIRFFKELEKEKDEARKKAADEALKSVSSPDITKEDQVDKTRDIARNSF